MVEQAKKDMQKMMGNQKVFTAVEVQRPKIMYGPPKGSMPPAKGVSSSKDVIRKGDAVTERETKRWEDSPAPGVQRHHHVVSEQTQLKGHDGSTIGTQERRKQESEAAGGHEEILPDGTKRKSLQRVTKRNKFSRHRP